MNICKLGKTKYSLCKIGLGTVQFGLDYGFTKKKTQDEVDEILSYADKKGINFIDTAREYGDSEDKIGNYISQNNNQLVVATKLSKITYEEADSKDVLKSKILASIETSLNKLKKNFLDIIQLHQTDSFLINNNNFWDILLQEKQKKVINIIGVSVYEEEETRYLIDNYGQYIDFFQVPFNIFDRRFEALKEVFSENQIGAIGRSVFLKGVIPCSEQELPEELNQLKAYKREFNHISEALRMDNDEVALLYAYSSPFLSSIILGVNSADQLRRNVQTVESKSLEGNISLLDGLKVTDQKLIDPRKWVTL